MASPVAQAKRAYARRKGRANAGFVPVVERQPNGRWRSVGAAGAAGAMGAALSGIPEMSLLPDEPVRCGIAGGGYGSQYAIAGGCAARIKDRVHLNTAIAYSPSVDYAYGSTSSFAGRVGISFPLGAKSKTSEKEVRPSGENWIDPNADSNTSIDNVAPSQALWYRTEVKDTIAKLQSDVVSRDEQIDSLKSRLELLIEQQQKLQPRPQAAEFTDNLIALLQQRIDELEEEKRKSALEDDKQNTQINELKRKLANQQTRFEAMMKKLQSLLPGKNKVKSN